MSLPAAWATLVAGCVAAVLAFYSLYPYIGEGRAAAIGFLIALSVVWSVAILAQENL